MDGTVPWLYDKLDPFGAGETSAVVPAPLPRGHSVGSGHGVQVVNLRVLRRDLTEVVEALQISQQPALVTKSGHLVGGDLAG